MIEAENLSWRYGTNQVLQSVSLAAAHGRVLGLIGPNGSGKTTLLRMLFGALSSPTGEVRVDGDELRALSAQETARRVAVVVQESNSDAALTVAEMVLLGRGPHLSTWQRTGPEDHAIVADALARVGAAHLATRSFQGLSGGERQRVLIARALAQQSTHLLLDEPTNHLDIRFQHEVLHLVSGLARDLNTTTIVVLHDLNLAARYCDDLVLLDRNRVVAHGPVADVLTPQTLEPVYRIGMERIESAGHLHLLFHPLGDASTDPARPLEGIAR